MIVRLFHSMFHNLQLLRILLIKIKTILVLLNKSNSIHNINKFKSNHKFNKKKRMILLYKELIIFQKDLHNLLINKEIVKMNKLKNHHLLINQQ